MTPLERAARAVEDQFFDAYSFPHSSDEELRRMKRDAARMAARAVLQAVRDPSEAMLTTAWFSRGDSNEYWSDVWRDMIDAALEEG